MAAPLQDQNVRSDKWLSSLVEAMEDISAADDICRAANPAAVGRLMEQLRSGRAGHATREFSRFA